MNVLLSAYACEPSKGSEPGVGWHWALEIAALGHSVWLLTRSNNRANIETGLHQYPGLPITPVYYDLPRWTAWWKRGGRGIQLYYVLWQAGAFLLARRLVKKVKFDLVHHLTFGVFRLPSFMGELGLPFVLGPIGGGEVSPAVLQEGLPLRGRIAEGMRSTGNSLALLNPLVYRMLSKARLVLCRTPETLGCVPPPFRERCRIHPDIGIDPQWILASARPWRGPCLITVSRLLYWKGIHLALDALAVVRQTTPTATFTIVGEGPDKAWLQQRALTVGVAEAVQWLGWMPHDQLKAIYREHTAMVFPSLHDSGGSVVLEAMASGTPVICLNTGGPGAIVPDDAGIKIDVNLRSQAEIVEELARAMLLVGEDEETAERLSKNAISFARRNSWHDVVKRAYSYPEIASVDPGRHNDLPSTVRDISKGLRLGDPGIGELLRRDWSRNRGNSKGILIMTLFRFAHAGAGLRRGPLKPLWFLALPYLVAYRIVVEWILGVELPQNTEVGPGLRLFHGQGLVVNDKVIVGADCTLRHNTTIGHTLFPDGSIGPSPVIGDGVEFGANVVVIGGISIGSGAVIGAGAVVVHDVPEGGVAVGNPARVVSIRVRSGQVAS